MTTTAPTEFAERLLGLFSDEVVAGLPQVYERYERLFTGSRFERLADKDPNRITANDMTAVSTLGVTIPAAVAIWLLSDEGQERTSTLLRPVPTDIDMWEDPALVAPGSELWQLWDELRTASWPAPNKSNDMGRTKISKLLATKRPRLVPVVDSVIAALLPSTGHWADFATALSNPNVRVRIEDATSSAPAHLSLLRRIDIALWMQSH